MLLHTLVPSRDALGTFKIVAKLHHAKLPIRTTVSQLSCYACNMKGNPSSVVFGAIAIGATQYLEPLLSAAAFSAESRYKY